MFKRLFAISLFTAACTGLPFPGFGGGHAQQQTQTSSESHSTSSQTEETHASINGEPIEVAEAEPPKKHKSSKRGGHEEGKKDFGATCQKNTECVNDRGGCYKGYGGEVGYCTASCDDDFGCPSFWECRRPAGLNTPSKICLQPKD